ncbi:uncharacterized protein LOC132743919 [Ruditapes philippinarum]|uniref:uncharacterized protein LOC132743919 n=1 Tax=Ruditapes philippinarum TaxID=129788 RepID=UPI00295BAF52|nr:uncharacterized protein LOC132743919 [Ruditapes philippinarum]
MASVTSLKGVRTRYRNTLGKELQKANELLNEEVSEIDPYICVKEIHKSKCLLKTYSEKLTVQMEKLINAIGDNDKEFVQSVLDEDCDLNYEAENCLVELEQLKEKIESSMLKGEETEVSSVTDTDRLVNVQEKMQRMLQSQMETQHEFFTYIDKKENFNYLQSKLGAEAKRAVAGLACTNDNYAVAVKILRERFGNKQEIVDLHYNEILNLRPPTTRITSLRMFLDSIERHLRALEVLGENIDQHIFVSMISGKLSEDILRQLEFNKGAKNEWTVNLLRCHLRDYIFACEKAERRKHVYSEPKVNQPFSLNKGITGEIYNIGVTRNSDNLPKATRGYERPTGAPFKSRSSAESLLMNEKQDKNNQLNKPSIPICHFCKKKHWSDECTIYKTVDERKQRLKGCCYRCLKEGHYVNECVSNRACVYCKEFNKHHRSLCPKRFTKNLTKNETQVHFTKEQEDDAFQKEIIEENVMVSHGETVFMQTASSTVKNPDTSSTANTRILLDCGSQRTYITQRLVNKLGLKQEGVEELKVLTFGSTHARVIKTPVTKLDLKLNSGKSLQISANIVPVISGNVQRKNIDVSTMEQIGDLITSLDLADSLPLEKESTTIELLIGNDYYLDLLLPQKIELLPGLYLLGSKLGWILTGRTNSDDKHDTVPNFLVQTYGSNTTKTSVFQSVDTLKEPRHNLEDFWKIESIGVNNKDIAIDDKYAMEKFKSTVRFENGRYQVTWPWKELSPNLPANRELAYGRLKSCLKKMRNKPEILEKYDSIIQDQLKKGVIEKVNDSLSDGLVHYIPHHAVITPQKNTTKIRVVYDASAKTSNENKSLNECLFRGPVLLHDLCGLLMRFRLHPVAIVSDIEKAFLQIGLQQCERDVTRFLWVKDTKCSTLNPENLQVYRFCRVPFGIISSPFLLSATIETHLDCYGTNVAEMLKKDIYVDNIITGVNSDEEAIMLYQTSKKMFSDAAMNLREWLTNSENVNNVIPITDRAEMKEMQVLGHIWDYKTDTIYLKQSKISDDSLPLTKRNILKRVASVFDPMGLFSPVVLRGKILLQELWSRGLDWDDVVNDEQIRQRWLSISQDLLDITEHKLPRNVKTNVKVKTFNLLCFCDASTKSYATSIYLHQEEKELSKTDLIFAKTRLAPVKVMTVPKLELMAVLVGVRCLRFVKEQLQLNIENMFLWTDSEIVIHWINSVKDLPTFVKNRVNEIKGYTNIKIGYVNTKENPADVATRGITTRQLKRKSSLVEWSDLGKRQIKNLAN